MTDNEIKFSAHFPPNARTPFKPCFGDDGAMEATRLWLDCWPAYGKLMAVLWAELASLAGEDFDVSIMRRPKTTKVTVETE